MRLHGILLIDLGGRENLISLLRNRLESSPFMPVHVLKDRCTVGEAAALKSSLNHMISFFDPDLLFLVLPEGFLNQREPFSEPDSSPPNYSTLVRIEIPRSFGIVTMLKAVDPAQHTGSAEVWSIMSALWWAIIHDCPEVPMVSSEGDLDLIPLIGENTFFVCQLEKIERAAGCSSGVLIEGEPGTGRKSLGYRIHLLSSRAKKSLVRTNCSTIPPDLAENEIFGVEARDRDGTLHALPGLVQKAEGGTLFLEEVDRLPPVVQIKLLRLLRDKSFKPPGSKTERAADVRVIGTLGNSARESVSEMRLRRDLYYGLSVISFRLPALRERREDIPHLARHFLDSCRAELRSKAAVFSAGALHKFAFYDWPGNIMELKHTVERAAARSTAARIKKSDIHLPCIEPHASSFREARQRFMTTIGKRLLQRHPSSIERQYQRSAEMAGIYRLALGFSRDSIRKNES